MAAPRPKHRPIADMTLRELHDQYDRNERLLRSSSASTSALVQRLSIEQKAISSRLLELEGVEEIRKGIKNANINADDTMNVDKQPRIIDAKRRALSSYAPLPSNGNSHIGSLTLQEAVALEQRAHAEGVARQQRMDERRKRVGLPIKGEILSRQEMDSRLWTFLNYKPTDSDLEDLDDDDDDDDNDPSVWFQDDQDDGIKGQDIVPPDLEDLSGIIRVDESKIRYSTFYEPRDID